MAEPDWIKCDKCGEDSNVIGRKPVTDARGPGLLALIDCPKCGEHEQWELQPGDGEDFSGLDPKHR
jgi:hypothetical protein